MAGRVQHLPDQFKGEDSTYRITITNRDTGLREDLTGATAIEFQVKARAGDADPPLISKTLASGITVLTQSGATKGQIDVLVTTADKAALTARGYKYDVFVTKGGRRKLVIQASDFPVRAEVNPA